MSIIFISPTCWHCPPCGFFQDSPSARVERQNVLSISLSAGGYKHKADMKCGRETVAFYKGTGVISKEAFLCASSYSISNQDCTKPQKKSTGAAAKHAGGRFECYLTKCENGNLDGQAVFQTQQTERDTKISGRRSVWKCFESWSGAPQTCLLCCCIKSSDRCLGGGIRCLPSSVKLYLPAVQQTSHQKPAALAFLQSAVSNFQKNK